MFNKPNQQSNSSANQPLSSGQERGSQPPKPPSAPPHNLPTENSPLSSSGAFSKENTSLQPNLSSSQQEEKVEDILSKVDPAEDKKEEGFNVYRPPQDSPESSSATSRKPFPVLVVAFIVIGLLLVGGGIYWWVSGQGFSLGKYFSKKETGSSASDSSARSSASSGPETNQNNSTPQNKSKNQSSTAKKQNSKTPLIIPTQNGSSGSVSNNQDDLNRDSDFDGLTDVEEETLHTNPQTADTDKDGLLDKEEIKVYHTDPLNPDTDGDGYKDGEEVRHGYDPNGPGKLFKIPQ